MTADRAGSSDLPPPLDVAAAIRARRSIKLFEDRPIPAAILEEIIALTLEAPSSYNLQPWRIVTVTDPAQRARLHAAGFRQPQFENAPVVLVFAVDTEAWRDDYLDIIEQGERRGVYDSTVSELLRTSIPQFQEFLRERGQLREYAIKDAMIAATHAVLAATAFGLGSCFMNGWKEDEVKEVIGASGRDDIAIAVIVPIGYPAQAPRHPGRLPRDRTVSDETL